MTCHWCVEVINGIKEACRSQSAGGYICTRPIGHEGDHVACGIRSCAHPVEKWSQTVEEAEKNEQ
jgi:hypothetical protein